MKPGVIDSAKVVRTALHDAASVAGLLITTEAMVAEKPKKRLLPGHPALAAWATWTSSQSRLRACVLRLRACVTSRSCVSE